MKAGGIIGQHPEAKEMNEEVKAMHFNRTLSHKSKLWFAASKHTWLPRGGGKQIPKQLFVVNGLSNMLSQRGGIFYLKPLFLFPLHKQALQFSHSV